MRAIDFLPLVSRNILKFAILLVACFFLVLALWPMPTDPCVKIADDGKDEVFIRSLELWVDQSITTGALERQHAVRSLVTIPGEYSVALNDGFLENKLGDGAVASIVVDENGKKTSVFIGGGNFQGFVVKISKDDDDAIPENILIPITNRTSMVCVPRD